MGENNSSYMTIGTQSIICSRSIFSCDFERETED